MTCAKQTVTATVKCEDGSEYTSTNWCRKPQEKCPRDERGYKTGEGYHLCDEVCQQTNHAEVNAINLAGERCKGAVIYLSGHTYACDSCKDKADKAGIREIIVCEY